MKKITLLLVFTTAIGISSFAQLGVKAGMNFAKMTDADKSLNNPQAGVFMDKDFIPLIKIRIGLDYSPKGAVSEYTLLGVTTKNEIQINYLELPVLAKVKLGPLYGLGGVYGAYAMNGINTVIVSGTETESDIDFDNVKRWDAGMKFGLGVQFKLGPLGAFAQTAYSFGIVDLNKSGGDELKNTGVLSFSVGVLLGN
ncbi:MAG: PorT family protein [Bacteroidales bacterium]|nr:PorT family protein [Bacteroidales bacterium]